MRSGIPSPSERDFHINLGITPMIDPGYIIGAAFDLFYIPGDKIIPVDHDPNQGSPVHPTPVHPADVAAISWIREFATHHLDVYVFCVIDKSRTKYKPTFHSVSADRLWMRSDDSFSLFFSKMLGLVQVDVIVSSQRDS